MFCQLQGKEIKIRRGGGFEKIQKKKRKLTKIKRFLHFLALFKDNSSTISSSLGSQLTARWQFYSKHH